jgi:uncharacterized protein YodC (DUF2158 family)
MDIEFKEGDCVQLKHGDSYKMTIAEVYELTKEAKCIWLNPKTRKNEIQHLPFSVLKHCPKEPTAEEKLKIAKEIFPPRQN